MNVNPDFEQTLDGYSDLIKTIALETRALIHKLLPEVKEVVWLKQRNTGFGTGLKKNTEHFCWISAAKNHVTLGFNYGVELSDPSQRLEGAGKLFRHIKLKSTQDLFETDVIDILKFAIKHRVPPVQKSL